MLHCCKLNKQDDFEMGMLIKGGLLIKIFTPQMRYGGFKLFWGHNSVSLYDSKTGLSWKLNFESWPSPDCHCN